MLEIEIYSLVVVDVQDKLAQIMQDREVLFKNVRILIKSAQILSIPILWCQQCPDSLGPTAPEIEQLLSENEPINKSSFSCCGDDQFNEKLSQLNVNQVLICGIETHVCIYQTAMDLIHRGLNVNVIADAVSSRTSENKQIALSRLAVEGVKICSTEMVLFEILKTAKHPCFKEIARLIK